MNGKITVFLGGKERLLKFSRYAVEKMSEVKGENTSASVIKLIYGGLHGAAFSKNEDADFTIEDVSDWVDEITGNEDFDEVILKINDVFSESIAFKNLQKKTQLNGTMKELA